jgi:hypothetical protein
MQTAAQQGANGITRTPKYASPILAPLEVSKPSLDKPRNSCLDAVVVNQCKSFDSKHCAANSSACSVPLCRELV